MAVLSNDTLYTIYQQNLSLLETQMELVKSTTFKNIGIYEWEKNLYISKTPNNTSSLNGTLQKRNNDILAGTRLYTFLLCSWLESRLNKILYEASSNAFTDSEREIVQNLKQMEYKWKACFNLALCKGVSISYLGIENNLKNNCKSLFLSHPTISQKYDTLFNYFDLIKGAIGVRNRLAHGQWETQLNSNSTNYATGDIENFFLTYNNIQKLSILFSMFKEIAEIISSYVVYKEWASSRQNEFDLKINKHMHKINHYKKEIETKSFDKYCASSYRQECAKRRIRR